MDSKNAFKRLLGGITLTFLMGCSSHDFVEKAQIDINSEVSVANMDVVQPLANIMVIPSENNFWRDLFVASKSTIEYTDLQTKGVGEDGAIISLMDEFVIADSESMNELLALCENPPLLNENYSPVVPGLETRVVKTTVRRAVASVNEEVVEDVDYPSISVQDILEGIIYKWSNSIKGNKRIRITIKLYFDNPLDSFFFAGSTTGPYTLLF